MEIKEKSILSNYKDFVCNLIPFGTLDIRRCVEVALEVGEDGNWAAEQVYEFSESCGFEISKCDPVFCVYDAILQEARVEIEELISFDFFNEKTDIYTSGNFIDTSYSWGSNAPEVIKENLIQNQINFNDLSEKTKWFLTQIDANY